MVVVDFENEIENKQVKASSHGLGGLGGPPS
jgi:hypothetical protein